MPKQKTELILLIILIPIFAYVGWQFYNSYFKSPSKEIEELEKAAAEEPTPPEPEQPAVQPPAGIELPEKPPEPKGTLDYTGFTERDPLKPSLPVKEKIEKPPEPPKPVEKPAERPAEKIKKEPPKEIVLPTFTVTGIVWGKESPRAIIDQQVYKIGDIVKGAKILEITQKGIRMIYEGKEFWVTIQRGG